MNSLNKTPATDDDITRPKELEAAISQFAERCYELPPSKQQFILGVLAQGPATHMDTFGLLLLMLENSDDDFNITSPELNKLITQAEAAHETKEHTN